MSKTIKVTIDPVGNSTVEAIGFMGQGCADATKGIEQALAGGAGKVTREIKDEWQMAEEEQQQQQHQSW